MNAIPILASQPWVERLGWTLLHFLWQGLLLSGLFAAARRSMTRSRPDARYLAACLTLAAMLAAPIATFLYLAPASDPAPPLDATARILNLGPRPAGAAVFVPGFAQSERPDAWISQAAPWIVAIWLCGAALLCLRLAGGWWMMARMRSRQIRPAPPEWQQTLTRLSARMRLSRPVRLLVSARIDVPLVVEWGRAVVLVPLGALSGLPAEQVEALLLHELAHIARRDYLVNMLQSIAEALLFYHPAVWWVSGHIRAERELCCDDLAVAATGDVFTYAIALAGLEEHRPVHAHSALAANGGKLSERIARLLGQSWPESRTFSTPAAAASAALLALTACLVFGQPAERPTFEVASVKPTPETTLSYSELRALPGGHLHVKNLTMTQLIGLAYHLQDYQVSGGPAWIRNAGFDIEAKGEPNANRAQLLIMLQPLLEDRFQLKFHTETHELPVYALNVARGGAKLPAPKPGGCVTPDGTPPAAGGNAPIPCGGLNMLMVRSGMRAQGGDVPMSELIRTLTVILGRPVLDRTGITTHFDATLTFAPDDLAMGLMKSNGSVAGHQETMAAAAESAAKDPKGPPNILAALQEQLGLKLDTTKGPVEVLVIDHLEKPSGN